MPGITWSGVYTTSSSTSNVYYDYMTARDEQEKINKEKYKKTYLRVIPELAGKRRNLP